MNPLIPIESNAIYSNQKINLEELIPVYLEEVDISSASKKTYQTALSDFFKFIKDSNSNNINRADIIRYKEELSKNHTATTTNLRLSVIRNFFSWTHYYGLYPDITFGVKGVRTVKTPKRQALTSIQVREILENIDVSTLCGRQQFAIVLLCATNGLRISEISSLNIGDLFSLHDQPVLQIKGKGYIDKSQIIPVGEATAAAIRSSLSLRKNFKVEDPMFISTSNRNYGSRITSKGIGQILKNLLQVNHFTGSYYTAHSFRHTACCLALEVTESDLISVKEYMRHENIETTLIYANHDQVLKNNIVSSIEKLILDQ